MSEWKKTQCTICGVSCGLDVEVEDGKVISCRPDETSPRSHGYCCRKGRNSKYFVEHGDRLDYPMKRVGDKFERISWDQAISEISYRLRNIVDTYGPRAICGIGGASGGDQSELVFLRPLIEGLGGQYMFNPIGFEFMGNWWSHGKIFGDQVCFLEPDDVNAEVVIFWGSNSFVTHQIAGARATIRSASEDPDRLLIDVDPRMSETARMADMHIMPRPGTDALLLRALIAMILDNGWEDKKYIEKYVGDFDKAREMYRGVDIKKSFEVCGVPYSQMEEFCRILTTRKWGLHQDLGLFCGRHSTLNSYLIITLAVICGVALVPGGCIVPELWATRGNFSDENSPKVWRTRETGSFPVLGTYPSCAMPPEMLSQHHDRIRAAIRGIGSPMRSYPDSHNVEKALKNLDLYVVMDIAWTEDCDVADYVLPVKSNFERYAFNAFQLNYPECVCTVRPPVITKQIAERRDSAEVILDIAKATGAIPKLPQWLYDAGRKAAETGDRMAYFGKLILWTAGHADKLPLLPAIVGETLGRAWGAPTKGVAWAALLTSPIADGLVEKAGYKPLGYHPRLDKLPKLKELFERDAAYQAVIDHPEGAVIAVADAEHPENYISQHIKTKDHKIHIYCDEVSEGLKAITPEKEAEAIAPTEEFPFVISSGRHSEDGLNAMTRNRSMNKYSRSYYKVGMNPDDVRDMGLKDGQMVRVTTRGGELVAPVESTYQICRGYSMIPHHYGIRFQGEVEGQSANEITYWKDMDEITGNPTVRFVKCRIEAV
jgi:anaerobic selenocysteine-containing dehydrogenase